MFFGFFYKSKTNSDPTKLYNKSLINLLCSVCTGKYCLRFLLHKPNLVLFYFLSYCTTFFKFLPIVAFPDKPESLTMTDITSTSVKISWQSPKDWGNYSLSRFCIKIKRDLSHVRSIFTSGRQYTYQINHLTPYTEYEISVAGGNDRGYEQWTISSFLTSEEGKFWDVCLEMRPEFVPKCS